MAEWSGRATVVAGAGVTLLACAVASAESMVTSHGARATETYVRSEHHYVVPDAILSDPRGKSFSLAQELAAEGPVVLTFLSTRCDQQCEALSATLAQVQNDAALRPRVISIATDPRHDTPARLREFASAHRVGPNWLLLTGRSAEINPVREALKCGGSGPTVMLLRLQPQAAWVRFEGAVSADALLQESRRLAAH